MARTKKYLTSSKTTPGHSFYRPIKRIPKPQAYSPHIRERDTTPLDELEALEEKIREAQLLKQKLQSQLSPKTSSSHYREPEEYEDEEEPAIPVLRPVTKRVPPQPQEEYHISLPRDEDDSVDFSDHDINEKITFLDKQLQNTLHKEDKFNRDISVLKESYESEKKQMEETIRSLRKDLHRTEPITDNKFFSISKELQEVVVAMNHLVENEGIQTSGSTLVTAPVAAVSPVAVAADTVTQPAATPTATPVSAATPLPTPSVQAVPPATIPSTAPEAATATPQPAVTTNPPELSQKKGLFSKIPKPLILLVLTLIIVSGLGGGAWYFLNRKTEVNTSLVQEYLPKDSQQAVTETSQEKKINESPNKPTPSSQPSTNTPPAGQTKGASDTKYPESQAVVPFADTKWETIKDHVMGLEISYPKNAVNVIKTDSSITFIRNTGYIFKIQIIETALDEKEYWKLIKASSLNYKVKETAFRDKPSLFLELEDFSDYPGDKYLVKNKDYIYDIWYATYSKTLSDDDAKRIEVMLNSFKFIDK